MKKVNGIKIYPKYALRSIFCSILCLFAIASIVLVVFLPMMTYTVGDATRTLTGFDFFNYVLDSDPIGFTIFDGIVQNDGREFFYLLEEGYAFHDPSLSIVTWYAGKKMIFNLIAIGFFIAFVAFAITLFVNGIINLVFGTYPKCCRGLYLAAFLCMTVFVAMITLTNFCYKYYLADANPITERLNYVYEGWIYGAWGLLFMIYVLECYLHSCLIKDKLYVSDAKKINTDRVSNEDADDLDDSDEEDSKKSKKKKKK